MLRRIGLSVSGLVLFLVCAPCCDGQEWARKMFNTTEHDFGVVARSAKAEHRFVFDNIYLEDIHIAHAYASCSCTSVRIENPLVKTYEQGAIVAHYNTDSFLGRRGATITVVIDRPFPAEVQLHVRGYIRGDVLIEPGSVSLGSIDQGNAADWNLSVKHIGYDDWRIIDVKSSNPHVSARAVETGRYYGSVSYELKVRVDAGAPPGYINDHIMLVTNDGRGEQIPVLVEGRVLPGITVSPASLLMGVVHTGQKVTRQLVVQGKTPFRILEITCDNNAFQFNSSADGSPKQLHLIPVTFQAGNKAGKVVETIRIKTDQGTTTQELAACAMVVEPETPDPAGTAQ